MKSVLWRLLFMAILAQVLSIMFTSLSFFSQRPRTLPLKKFDPRVLHRERLRHKKLAALRSTNEVYICLVSTNPDSHMIHILNSMAAPPEVMLNLLLVITPSTSNSSFPQWTRGRSTVLSKIAWTAPHNACFIIMDDTSDPGPFMVYWFWRMCKKRDKDTLLSGDIEGTALAPTYELWMRYGGDDYRTQLMKFSPTMLHPPMLDESVLIRPTYQSLTERERPPVLARIWTEAFVNEAITTMRE